MRIRQLKGSDIAELLQTVNAAFVDYIVPFQLDMEQLLQKIRTEDIRLEWSVGVFNEDKLVAFMLHAVRERDHEYVVYNGGTGVLPEFRGHGLVGKMYVHLLPFFSKNKVKEIVLEAIESNSPAIHAYEKSGFLINRQLLCFNGVIQPLLKANLAKIKALPHFSWKEFQSFWTIFPSWQSTPESMDNIKPKALGAFMADKLVGYILFNPGSKRVYQIAVAPEFRRNGIGTQLLQAIKNEMPLEKIQFNNIDAKAGDLKLFLEKQGLVNVINQLEMVKSL